MTNRMIILLAAVLLVGCGAETMASSLITPAVDAPQWVQILAMIINMLPSGGGGDSAAIAIGILSAMFFGALFIFRAIAEILGHFYMKTTNKVDDKLFNFFGQAAKFCAKIIGMFGFGYPPKLK